MRHPLTPGVRAEVAGGELRVHGDGWAGRVVVAPGDGPAAAAAAAAKRIDASVPLARGRARARLRRFTAAAEAHAAACLGARGARWRRPTATPASATPTARGWTSAWRISPTGSARRRWSSRAELGAARDRLAQARAHLASPPAQPYAWLAEWPPAVAGAMLRDLPGERLEPARAALRRLADAAGAGEPLLALAAGTAAVAAVTPSRVLIAERGRRRA